MTKTVALMAIGVLTIAACAGDSGSGEADTSLSVAPADVSNEQEQQGTGDGAVPDDDEGDDLREVATPGAASGASDEQEQQGTGGGAAPDDDERDDLRDVATPSQIVKPTVPEYGGGEGVIESGLEDLVRLATADLAARLNTPSASITVVSAQSVVWPDGSIGCPQPDMNYTQVQVDGAQVVLRHGDIMYDYHSGGQRGLFLCGTGS